MRIVRKYVLLAAVVLIYLFAIFVLLQQSSMYRTAYQSLSRLISHPSVEVIQENGGEKH